MCPVEPDASLLGAEAVGGGGEGASVKMKHLPPTPGKERRKENKKKKKKKICNRKPRLRRESKILLFFFVLFLFYFCLPFTSTNPAFLYVHKVHMRFGTFFVCKSWDSLNHSHS